jgi:hypothetical protein
MRTDGTLRKEGRHRSFDNLEFWPEDGLVYMEDKNDGTFNVVTCRDFALRARCINEEAKRAKYPSDRDRLNDLVLNMFEVWKEAVDQGDPSDPKIALQKYKERRKTVLLSNTGW